MVDIGKVRPLKSYVCLFVSYLLMYQMCECAWGCLSPGKYLSHAEIHWESTGVPCAPPKSNDSKAVFRGRYHGGRRPSSDDSFHSPTVIPPSPLDKPSIVKRYHRRRTCSHTSPRRSPTMVTFDDTRFVECRLWNDGWTVKTGVT